jgi:uncharacterized membrane protein
MNCLRCNTENDQSTKFCKNCGANLQPKPVVTSSSLVSDILLFIFIMIIIFTSLSQFVIQKFFKDWFMNSSIRYTLGMVWIIRSLSFILVPISLKNNILKILGIIFMSMLVLYFLYEHVTFMITDPYQRIRY